MINGFLLCFLFSVILCIQFQELPKYDYIYAIPNNYVYLDISSFEVGKSIYLEFSMDLFFSKNSKESYSFKIAQVPAKSKDDYKYWSSLPTVVNNNYTNNSAPGYYNYSWVEIKQEGMNYIYIIPLEPFKEFYTIWKNDIFIINNGGMSKRELMRRVMLIAIPSVIIVAIAIIVIVIYFKKRKKNVHIEKDFPPAIPAYQQPTLCPQIKESFVHPEQEGTEKPIDP